MLTELEWYINVLYLRKDFEARHASSEKTGIQLLMHIAAAAAGYLLFMELT